MANEPQNPNDQSQPEQPEQPEQQVHPGQNDATEPTFPPHLTPDRRPRG